MKLSHFLRNSHDVSSQTSLLFRRTQGNANSPDLPYYYNSVSFNFCPYVGSKHAHTKAPPTNMHTHISNPIHKNTHTGASLTHTHSPVPSHTTQTKFTWIYTLHLSSQFMVGAVVRNDHVLYAVSCYLCVPVEEWKGRVMRVTDLIKHSPSQLGPLVYQSLVW